VLPPAGAGNADVIQYAGEGVWAGGGDAADPVQHRRVRANDLRDGAALRHRLVDERGEQGQGGRGAGTAPKQPGHLRSDGDRRERDTNSNEGEGDLMNVEYPFHFQGSGRTATTDDTDHIRDMLEQLLFTNPGERVNRPDFGSGLLGMVFEPNSPEQAAVLQAAMQAAVLQELGDLIELQTLEVTSEEETLRIVVNYAIRQTGESRTDSIERSGV
jgi:uncharacterized protein